MAGLDRVEDAVTAPQDAPVGGRPDPGVDVDNVASHPAREPEHHPCGDGDRRHEQRHSRVEERLPGQRNARGECLVVDVHLDPAEGPVPERRNQAAQVLECDQGGCRSPEHERPPVGLAGGDDRGIGGLAHPGAVAQHCRGEPDEYGHVAGRSGDRHHPHDGQDRMQVGGTGGGGEEEFLGDEADGSRATGQRVAAEQQDHGRRLRPGAGSVPQPEQVGEAPGPDQVCERPDDEEQGSLVEGVAGDLGEVPADRPEASGRGCSAHAVHGDQQAEMAHRRVGEDLLQVALVEGQHRPEQHRDRADRHQQRQPEGQGTECREHAPQQEHSGLHHGGRVQVRRDRRRRLHGARQPVVEGPLGALGGGPDEHQHECRHHGAVVADGGRLGHEVAPTPYAGVATEEEDSAEQGKAAQARGEERLHGPLPGIGVVPVPPDEEEGAD